MGKKKIQTILAVSAMVGSATIVGHQIPTSQNSTILFENSNNQADSSKSNKDIKQTNSKSNNLNKTTNLEQVNINQNPSNKPIDYKKDLKIVVTGINIDKVSDGSNNPNTSYQPENNVPSTGNIVTQNTTVTYSIHVSLRSASGRIYPVSGASLTANPIVSYMGIKNETPQEKEALNQLQQSMQVQLNKLKNLNSTSTFVISASFSVGYADWNAQIVPNLTLNITTPDGKVISMPLDIKPLKETMQYTDNVIANPSIVSDSDNEHCHYLRIGINNQVTPYSPGVYSPKNQNAKTVTFTINNPDTKNITITPLNIPGLTKNSNGTYTASVSLLDSGHNLFKITTNTDSQLRVPITVTPVKEELESSSSNINATEATKMNYYGGQAILNQRDFGCHFSMTQSSQNSYTSQPNYEGYNNNKVTFGSTMTTGVPGKYNVYTGSLVTNGEIVVKNANAPQGVNLINNGQVYCHLDDSAVNILESGTPSEKAQIMEDIVSGNMSGIGVKYTSSELQTLMNEGKTVPSLNFTYVEKGYDGGNFNDGSSYVTIPTNGNNNPVISRTITFGDLQGTYSQDEQEQMSQELKEGQLPSDGVFESNGKLQGFILSPPNSYTDSLVKSEGIGQITDERYGNYSHGLSAAYNSATANVSVTIDNIIGSSTQTTTSVEPYSWFLKQHQFNVNIQGYGDGPSLMLNNTTITINMGHSFKLIPGKPLYFGSAKLSPSDYSVDGDKLIIHLNKNIAQSLGSAPTITFNAQYTDTQSIGKDLTLGVSLSGNNSGDGMVYQYNNKEVSAQQGGIPTINSYKTQIVISQVVSNQCIHSATNLPNNEVQLQDQVINNNLKSKTYYIAGEIPITGSNNLPGNDGEPSTGGLSSELQTLNTGGAPTWVLPKSAMNSENENILTSASGNDLKGSLKYIESPNSGWIKYKPGMNLNNIIGYFTTPTVGPRDEFNMTYNVKLKQGDNPNGLPEVVNSAFKYYDVTDNIGSTSNIVNITTPGTDLSNSWISTVKEVDGGKLTQQDLDKTVTINGKTISLKDFIGTGPDLDSNYDSTPTKLMNEVTLSQDKEALAKLGYQLVNITVNGKVRDLSWFQNTGIAFNTGLTEVIFNIKKTVTKADTTVTENYSNGRQVVQSVTTNNIVGSKVNTGLPTLPEGYKVIKVTVNGKVVPQDEVPTTQSKDNQTIVYTIGKIPNYKDIVKVVDSKGNQVGNIETATGETGKETGLKVPEIPKGYHVVSITNGNGEKVNGVPTTFGDSDNTTIYHIEKDITDKVYVDVKTETGTIITPSHEVASGAPGSKISVEMPNIPSEYHIEKVLVNGKVIKPDAKGQYELPNTLSNNTNTEVDDHIEVIVAKTPTTTVEEKYQDGTSVVPNKTTVNLQGTKVNTGLPELPSGYKVIKVTVNGQEVPESEVPTVQSAKDQTIVYTIGKVSTDTVKVVDESNNQIGSTVSKTGVSGTETGLKTPTIPNGYHIVNVTDNGKVITTGVPSKFTDNNQNIVYHIAKDVTTTVKEVYSNGEPVTPSVTTTNNIGAKVNTGLPELPKGYQVVKVTVNGQEVTQSEVPSTQGSKDQVIIYTIGKQPTDTIKVINEKGIQVGKTISVTGDTGSKTGLEVPTIPNGYHVVSEIINGKEGTGVPSTFGDSNTNIIYNIAPNVKDETYGSIVTDTGKTLVPVTPLNQGEPGSKATVQMPNIPKGYKIVKVTINNGEVPISSNGKYEVTYDNNVSKEVDNKIVITVKHIPVQDTIKVMEGSKVISTTKTKEGMPGEETGIQTPNIPNGYHIDKITVDGNTVTTVPKTFGDSNQTIIYHLTENKVNDIKADVVTESGQPLVNNTTVAEGPEGSDVTCDKTEIPEGYHLVKVEYNGKVISSTTGGKVIYMLPDTIPTGKAGQLTYVVAANTSTVIVKVVGGPGLKPYSHTTSGTVGSKITGDIPPIPKGYKVTNITVNGHAVSENKLPETYGNKTYNIVYHVVKIPTGEIQQTVVTTTGTVIEKPTIVASGEVGNSITVKPYTPPEGYHIVKVEIDGKELTTQEEKDLIHNLPNTINSPKTEVVKYVIAKDTTPSVAQKGTIIIKVVDQQNISVVPEKTYTGTVGDKTPNMVPTIPNGDTLQKITSGQVTPVSGLPDTFSPGVHIYVYHVIEHKGSLTYTINVNGQPIRREYLTGVDGQTASYGLPHNKDWKLENIIVDGKKIPVDGNSDYHGVYSEDGTQVIYNYKTVTPNVTPQPTKPVKPEHKDTPIVKPNKGDNTPSGDVNHNGGNTTPSQSGDKENTPNKGDNTPSKGGNTTPSHDSGDHTSSKPSKGDNTPSGDINHNGGNTTPSQSGDKGNTPNKGDNTPSKSGNTTPSHDSGDHTPSKPSKGDNTPSGDVNHNGGNTTPSQSGDRGNTTPSQGGDKGNTPNKGDNTPSGNKDANNGGSTKTSTSTHTEVTGGGEAHSTGTAHATVNGSGSSTSTSSSSVTGGNNNSTGTSSNTTPNVVSGGNTVTPHVVVNTTSSNRSDSNGITPTVSNNTTTSNGNDTTPFNSSSVSSSAGSTYTDNNLVNGPNEDDSTAQTVLPHTGLSTQNVENTAEQAGALAGIMAMLGGVFFFRRKK